MTLHLPDSFIDPKTRKAQLHVSAIDTFTFCGEQGRRRYVENEKIPPGFFALMGRGVDAAVSADMTNKVTSEDRSLLPDDQVATIARDALVYGVNHEGVRLDPNEDGDDLNVATGKAIDRTVRLALTHHGDLAPWLDPISIQRAWVVRIDGFPVDLAGTFDLESLERRRLYTQASDAEIPRFDAFEAIRDTKTKKQTPPEAFIKTSIQMTAYALAKFILDKRLPGRVMLDVIVDTKIPKVVTYEDTRTRSDFEPFLERVVAIVRAIDAGVFLPAKAGDPLCSPRFCGYYPTCRFVRNPVSVSVPASVSAERPTSSRPQTLEQQLVASLDEARAKRETRD